MKDQDFRDAIRRLATLVLELADDSRLSLSETQHDHAFRADMASGEAGRIEVRQAYPCVEIHGWDGHGAIDVALRVDPNAIEGQFPLRFHPRDLEAAARSALRAVEAESMTDAIDLPAGADEAEVAKWRRISAAMAEMARAAGDMETGIRQTAGKVQPHAKLLGKRRWDGFTPELEAMVATLAPMCFLTWTRATSSQALTKRRENGLPVMGRADLRRSALSWKPDTAIRGQVPFGVALRRPPIQIARTPEIPVPAKERFAWRMHPSTLVMAQTFAKADPAYVPALLELMRLDSELMRSAPRLTRTGGYWADMSARPANRIKITSGQANLLTKRGILHSDIDEEGNETLLYGSTLHALVYAMGLGGYSSLKGVTSIAEEEMVPEGIAATFRSHVDDVSAGVVAATSEGYERHGKYTGYGTDFPQAWNADPVPLHAEDNVLSVVSYDDMVWPNFGAIDHQTSEGLATEIDPAFDPRPIAGPLGRLYRMPAEDRVLVTRRLFAWQTEQNMPHDWYEWVHEG